MSVDRCMFCGDIVPEGRGVCPACEKRFTAKVEINENYKYSITAVVDSTKLLYRTNSYLDAKRYIRKVRKTSVSILFIKRVYLKRPR